MKGVLQFSIKMYVFEVLATVFHLIKFIDIRVALKLKVMMIWEIHIRTIYKVLVSDVFCCNQDVFQMLQKLLKKFTIYKFQLPFQ